MAKHDQPVFQGHHVIEQDAYSESELLQKLEDRKLFALHGDRNLLNLPADKQLALRLEVTPHNGGPLGQYSNGLERELEKLADSRDGQAFLQNNDLEAGGRIGVRVNHLCDTLKVAMVNGDLLTNTPEGMTPKAANAKNAALFENLAEFQRTHAIQIEAVGKLTGPEARWPAVLKSESHLTASLETIDQPGKKTIKGNAAKGMQSLSDAVDSAQNNGRLVLTEEGAAAAERAFRVPRGQGGFISSELLVGNLSPNQALRMGGVALTGIDAIQSVRSASALWSQDNDTGATSELIHFTTRNVGGWGGAVLGASFGAAVSSPTGPGAIIGGIVGGAVGVVGGEKVAELLDHQKIYRQEDSQGKAWTFDPEKPVQGWRRLETVDELAASGRPIEGQHHVVAVGELESQLNRKATTASLELMLARPPVPSDPYALPAEPGDAFSSKPSAWRRDPASGAWARDVYERQYTGAERESHVVRETVPANAAHSVQLEAQSQIILRENVHLAPSAMAARFELSHHDSGWTRYEALPASAANALRDDGRLIGSDGAEYLHQQDGRWERSALFGFTTADATATIQLELDSTRNLLREGLVAHREMLAERPQPAAHTLEASMTGMAKSEYAIRGLTHSPEALSEIGRALAVDYRVRGLDGPLMMQLQPDPDTNAYGPDSPMGVYTRGTDGDMTLRFTMTPMEAKEVLAAQPTSLAADMPQPASPERTIVQATPEQRNASEQAQREANRQGLSQDDAQQAAKAAVIGPSGDPPRAPDMETDTPSPRDKSHEPAAPSTNDVSQAAAFTPARDPDALHPGDRNSQVELLQYRLDRQGYRGPDNQPIPQDGHYSPDTEHAVRQFQQDRDLPVTGTADLATQYAAAQTRAARVGPLDTEGQDSTKTIAPTLETASPPIERPAVSERDAMAQIAREANLQGLSQADVTQVMQDARAEHAAPAPGLSMRGGSATQVRPDQDDQAHDQDARTRTSQEPSVPSSEVPAMAAVGHRAASLEREEEDRAQKRERGEPSREAAASRETSPEITAAAPVHPSFDPRHPDHPDHRAMYLNAREKIADLYERHGIPMQEDKLEVTTAAVLSDARAERMTKIAAVEFTATEKYGNVSNVDGKLVAWSHDPAEKVPWSKASLTDTQTLDQRDPDRDYARFREETIKEEKSLAEFQKQQEEINRNPTGPVMTMGARTLQPAGGPSDDGGNDGGGGGDG